MKGFNIFYLWGMKLSEYFQQQKSQAMTSHMKSQLFSRIQKEKHVWIEVSTKIPSKLFFFASRKLLYTSFAAILVVVVFWWLLLDRNDTNNFWLFSVQRHTNPSSVLADYVAEIIEFNWEYSLERDWVIVSNLQDLKLIEDGDIIYLSEWTNLVFTLIDGTQAKIVWPAEFSIVRDDDKYKISLVDWKFFRIYCPECVSDIEIITPDLSIHQDKNQALDVHIAREENWEILVKNDWDEVTVTATKVGWNKQAKITSSELMSLAPSSESVDVIEDSDLMELFLTKNNISATFTLSNEAVDWPTVKPKPSNDILAMETNNITDIDNTNIDGEWMSNVDNDLVQKDDPLLEWIIEVISSDIIVTWTIDSNISSELWLLLEDEQQVPSADQMQALKTNVNSFFLMNLFEGIYTQDKSDQNIAKLAERMNAVAIAFWYTSRASSDLLSIKNLTLELKNNLQKDRYISPSYILQLEKIWNWCDELLNPSRDSRSDLQSSLPTNLRLM